MQLEFPRSWRDQISGLLDKVILDRENLSFATEMARHEVPAFLVSTVQKQLPGYESQKLGTGQGREDVSRWTNRKMHMNDIVSDLTNGLYDDIDQLKGVSSIVSLDKTFEETEKIFRDRLYGVPKDLVQPPRYNVYTQEEVLADPTKKEEYHSRVLGLESQGYIRSDINPHKVLRENLPTYKEGDPNPHDKVDSGFYKESWIRPYTQQELSKEGYSLTDKPNDLTGNELWEKIQLTVRQGYVSQTAGQAISGIAGDVVTMFAPMMAGGVGTAPMAAGVLKGTASAGQMLSAGKAALAMGSYGGGLQKWGDLDREGGLLNAENDFEAVANTLEFALGPVPGTVLIGQSDNIMTHIMGSLSTGGFGKAKFPETAKALDALFEYDPTVDTKFLSEGSVKYRQALVDAGLPEEQADFFMHRESIVSMATTGDPEYIFNHTKVRKMSEASAQDIYESTMDNSSFALNDVLFQTDETVEDKNFRGMIPNTSAYFNMFEELSGTNQLQGFAGFRDSTLDFDKDRLIMALGGHNLESKSMNIPDNILKNNPQYSTLTKYMGMENNFMGLTRWLDQLDGDRVSLSKVQERIQTHGIKIKATFGRDDYADEAGQTFNAFTPGAKWDSEVILLQVNVADLPDDHIMKRNYAGLLQGDDPSDPMSYTGLEIQYPASAQHYGANLQLVDTYGKGSGQSFGEVLITPKGFEPGLAAPVTENIIQHVRLDTVRDHLTGKLVRRIGEFQSDTNQKMANVSIGELTNTIITGDNIASPFNIKSGDASGRWLIHNSRNETITIIPTDIGTSVSSGAVGADPMLNRLLQMVDEPELFEILDDKGSKRFIARINRDHKMASINNGKRYEINQFIAGKTDPADPQSMSLDKLGDQYIEVTLSYKTNIRPQDTRYSYQQPHPGKVDVEIPIITIKPVDEQMLGLELNQFDTNLLVNVILDGRVRGSDVGAPRVGRGVSRTSILYDEEQIEAGEAYFAFRRLDPDEETKYISSGGKEGRNSSVVVLDENMQWSLFPDQDSANAGIRQWLIETADQTSGQVPLPPSATFHTGYSNPTMKLILNQAARRGEGTVSWSGEQDMYERWGKDALAYAFMHYGDHDGATIPKTIVEVITPLMQKAGFSKWTDANTRSLFDEVTTNIGVERKPLAEFRKELQHIVDEQGNRSTGLETPVGFTARVNQVSRLLEDNEITTNLLLYQNTDPQNTGEKIVRFQAKKTGVPWKYAGGRRTELKNIDELITEIDRVIGNIEYKPYELDVTHANDDVNQAIRVVLSSITPEELEQSLETMNASVLRKLGIDIQGDPVTFEHIPEVVSLYEDATVLLEMLAQSGRQLDDSLKELSGTFKSLAETHTKRTGVSHVLGGSDSMYYPNILLDSKTISRSEIDRSLAGTGYTPFVDSLDGTISTNPVTRGGAISSDPLSVDGSVDLLTILEMYGIPTNRMTHGTSSQTILNLFTNLALERRGAEGLVNKEAVDSIVGIKDIAKLKVRDVINEKHLVKNAGFKLDDNLLDPAFRAEKGLPDPDNLEGVPQTIAEALMREQMTMFQMNNDIIPDAGKILGMTDFFNDGRAVISFVNSANLRTGFHELGHVVRRILNPEQLEIAGRAILGSDAYDALPNKGLWTRVGEEAFADAFMDFAMNDYASSKEMRNIFQKIKDWFITLARSIKGTQLEEKMNPELTQLFEILLKSKTPSKRKIFNNIPVSQHGAALNFFGHNENTVRFSDDGTSIDDSAQQVINRLFRSEQEGGELEDVIPLPVEEMSSLTDFEELVNTNFAESFWKDIADKPGVNPIVGTMNPSGAANDPLKKALRGLAMLEFEGIQKADIAFTRLSRLGRQDKIWGALDEEGFIAEGALKGLAIGDIMTTPNNPAWKDNLTPEMREFTDTFITISEGKLRMFNAEGIDIKQLDFEEGGHYIDRRVMGKIHENGEIVDIAVIGGPSRMGKTSQERNRVFPDQKSAINAGYRYMQESDALYVNLVGMYRRIAQKRFMDYLVNNVKISIRSTAVPESVANARVFARKRVEGARTLMAQLQNARTGGQIHAQTRKALENLLPEIEGMLDDVSRISLQQLVKAGKIAADQPTTFVPRKKMIRELFKGVKQLEDEIAVLEATNQKVPTDLYKRLAVMKQKLGFSKFQVAEAYKNFEETGKFEYTWSKSATSILMEDRIGAIDEVLTAIRGEQVLDKSGNTKYIGGLLSDLQLEYAEINEDYLKVRDELKKIHSGEATIAGEIPAFSGKIFTENQNIQRGVGKKTYTGAEVVDAITESIVKNNEWHSKLRGIQTYNQASKFFMLAGDLSPIWIQLIMLTGASVIDAPLDVFKMGRSLTRTRSFNKMEKPLLYKLFKGALHAWMDETYHAKLLDDNKDLLLRHPGVKVSIRGTEFTSFAKDLERAGFLRSKPVKFAGDIPVIGQAGKMYGGFFKGSARAFETVMDEAAIHLLQAYDDIAIDPKSTQQLDDFVNAIRGVGVPERIGISRKQRQWESILFLASGYNRAIAALFTQLAKGGITGKLARRKFAKGITGVSLIGAAISIANGEDVDELIEHYDPTSPMFMTWNLFGQNVGPGSKIRSIIKLMATLAVSVDDDAEVHITDFRNMDHPVLRFARGLSSPFIADTTDILTGSSYLGEKVSFLEPWTVAEHILLPKIMPIWAQSVATEGGSAHGRSVRGVAEFMGWRAYPEGAYQILNNYSKEYLNIDYKDLEPFERKMLRDILKDDLGPMTYERAQQGDPKAMYWIELDIRDQERLAKEQQALEYYWNPRLSDNRGWRDNPSETLQEVFGQIQEDFAQQRNELNKEHEMYQDDNDFDPDDPHKYALGAWYNVFDEVVDPKTGQFNHEKYKAITEEYFWTRTNPVGGTYGESADYIRRNTHFTEHPEDLHGLLPSHTTDKWATSNEERQKFLSGRGNWKPLLDKVGLGQ